MTDDSRITAASRFPRRLMLGGAGAAALVGMLPASSAASEATMRDEGFMAASNRLIQHALPPDLGARLGPLLRAAIPTFDADVNVILRVASETKAKSVEDFFPSLPEGTVVDTAHRIIYGWYAGVIDDRSDAEVIAYEQALMYQPTRDAVAMQTYSFDGPDHWTELNPPLAAMPDF